MQAGLLPSIGGRPPLLLQPQAIRGSLRLDRRHAAGRRWSAVGVWPRPVLHNLHLLGCGGPEERLQDRYYTYLQHTSEWNVSVWSLLLSMQQLFNAFRRLDCSAIYGR